jgi:transcription antitermination factor NusG
MAAAEVLASTISALEPGITAIIEPHWYAVCTRSRHEKSVAEHCAHRSITNFVPLYESVRRWKNGRHRVSLPLFPGYAFVRIALANRLDVLKVPGVVHLVSFNGLPSPVANSEIESLQRALAAGRGLAPHPYLTVGRRVRIKSGPLAGLEAVVIRQRSCMRAVLSINLIQRSMALDIESVNVEPCA